MNVTIKQIIELLPSAPAPLEQTVDQLLYGDEQQVVSKVGIAFMANQEVLEQAVALDISLIISHEGLYYSHHQAYPAANDPELYKQRERYIKEHKLAIYRYHDHCHRHVPDYITRALVQKLNWQSAITDETANATILKLPPLKLEALIKHVKQRLQLPYIRYRGDLDATCVHVGVLVGFRGNGSTVIPLIAEHQLDAIIIGEGLEWEAPEYVRDAAMLGKPCALIVLGHAESEQPAMELLATQLSLACPQLIVQHLAAKPLYTIG